ncbi:MAG: low temperature requirement protein A [Chloroflexi bacterium]|nr:MAG: low temperature requirement protein A [Chloroflexota bacterium]
MDVRWLRLAHQRRSPARARRSPAVAGRHERIPVDRARHPHRLWRRWDRLRCGLHDRHARPHRRFHADLAAKRHSGAHDSRSLQRAHRGPVACRRIHDRWLSLVPPLFGRTGGFRIRVGHFVERHGLILLIAIGESVVAVGIGLGNAALPAGRILTAVLGLALAASLWWLYFNGDEERAAQAMEGAHEERRPWLAVLAFGYFFLPILGGIVVVAAGMKLAVVAYNEPAALSTALFLATGVAAYATGLVLFRWLLHSGPISIRLAIAVLVMPTALIGIAVTPLAQLAAVVAILVGGSIVDSAVVNRRSVR